MLIKSTWVISLVPEDSSEKRAALSPESAWENAPAKSPFRSVSRSSSKENPDSPH